MAEKQRQDAPFQRSRTDESPSSGETLNGHDMDGEQKERGRRQEQEKTSNDEEKGGHEDSPQPVGFFSKELNKVRLQVFGLWARTSWFTRTLRIVQTLTVISTHSGRLYLDCSFLILGCPLPCGEEYVFFDRFRCWYIASVPP